MSLIVACPKCRKRYSVPAEAAGKRIRCKQCGGTVRVPTAKATPADDDFLDALDDVAAEDSSAREPALPPPPLPAKGRKKRKKSKPAASETESAPPGIPQYALVGAIAGAMFFVIFVVIDWFVFGSAEYSIVHKQPGANFVLVMLVYGTVGAVFGAIVTAAAKLFDSMAAGLAAGAVVMALQKGIGMAVIAEAGAGFRILGLVVGAIYGLFFSWAILSSIREMASD